MKRPEESLQRQVASFLRATVPAPPMGPVWFHVPNGGARSRAEAGIFKAMGVRAGMLDLVFLWRRSFLIELKGPNGSLSLEQKATIADLELLGIPTFVCRSMDEVQAALNEMGVPLLGRIAA